MLEHYYLKPDSIDRIRHDWLGEPIEQYVSWLHNQEYSSSSIVRRVPLLMRFSEFCKSNGASSLQELPQHVEPFLEKWKKDHHWRSRNKLSRRLSIGAARVPIQQMLCLILPEYSKHVRQQLPVPFSQETPGFFPYLRGLQETTINGYCHSLRSFETYLKKIKLHQLNKLSCSLWLER